MSGEQRFVINARIVGSVHRDTPKLKMFMISVLWSDETEVIIYRSFQNFKKFHRQLKKRFPHLNPFRKSDRVIPKFRGQAIKSSMQQKGSKKSIQRMKFLESYCSKLLKCDQTVTRSSELTQFFTPKDNDLQPDFTKNSILILLSDDLPDGSGGGGVGVARPHTGSVTHPFITQSYRCIAAYETKDVKNRPFKVAVNEKLDVLIKDPAGWWLVENEDKRLAWFPAPYLELLDGEDDDDAECQLGGSLYCAVRSFSSKKADEVSVPIGSVVEVLRKSDSGWWLIRFSGTAGYIPSMYLQPYNNPCAGLFGLQRRLHSSSLNLATSTDPQASHPPSVSEEHSTEGSSRSEPSVPGRLQKARSLDILSESWQLQTERVMSTSDNRMRSMSNTSSTSNTSNTSFSSFSSDSESSSSLREESYPGGSAASHPVSDSLHSSPDLSFSKRGGSDSSSESSRSVQSKGSDVASGAPRVPPRPKTEEIMTRCTTMTRKAALATKTRLQIQPENIHSR